MEKWKKIGKKLLFPNIFIIILFTIISAAALFYVFSNGLEASWFAYVFYFISSYALTILVAFCCMTIRGKYRIIKQKMLKNSWGNRYLTDAAFRTQGSLYIFLLAVSLCLVYYFGSLLYGSCGYAVPAFGICKKKRNWKRTFGRIKKSEILFLYLINSEFCTFRFSINDSLS